MLVRHMQRLGVISSVLFSLIFMVCCTFELWQLPKLQRHTFIEMPSKYQALQDEEEKFQPVEFVKSRSSSVSTSGSTLLFEEVDLSPSASPKRTISEKWMWLIHAVLLTLSFTMFAASYYKPISISEVVKKSSSYCKLVRHNYISILTRSSISSRGRRV